MKVQWVASTFRGSEEEFIPRQEAAGSCPLTLQSDASCLKEDLVTVAGFLFQTLNASVVPETMDMDIGLLPLPKIQKWQGVGCI